MNILRISKITTFTQEYPQYAANLNALQKILKANQFTNFAELRKLLSNSVDLVGKCTVFNIHGNDVRLIVQINYTEQRIFIQDILTHTEYDKNKWKKNCKRN